MSNKIDLSLVSEALKLAKVPSDQSREVIERLNAQIAQEEATKEPKAPKAKSQHVILTTAKGFGFVVSIPEDASPLVAIERVVKVAHDFNASKKGRLLPVKSVGEAFESIGPRWWKENDVKRVTKVMVPILEVANTLPAAPSV